MRYSLVPANEEIAIWTQRTFGPPSPAKHAGLDARYRSRTPASFPDTTLLACLKKQKLEDQGETLVGP